MTIGGRAGALLVALVVALARAGGWRGDTPRCSRRSRRRAACSPNRRHEVRLTYSERIEPRFAVISVTDADGNQQIAGSPARTRRRSRTRSSCPLKRISQGWYLVWWRVISADGHPVRGAFTFAVGPSPGPPPQFVIPSLGESAATTSLVGIALGAAARDAGRHRPARVPRRDRAAAAGGRRQRARPAGRHDARPRSRWASRSSQRPSTSCWPPRSSRSDPGATSGRSCRSCATPAFGRAFSDLWGVLALLAVAAAAALALDRPGRKRRSGEALLALFGAAGCAAAALALPGPRRAPLDDQPRRASCSRSTGRTWPPRRSGSAGSSGCSCWPRRPRPGSASRCSRSSSRASRAWPWAASPSCSPRASSRASCTCRRSARSGRRATGRR